MKFLIATLLVLAAVAAPRKKSEVSILSQTVSHPSDCVEDPLRSVCTTIDLVIENRSFKTVEATIGCGSDMDESVITLSPRTRMSASIDITLQIEDPKCTLKTWAVK